MTSEGVRACFAGAAQSFVEVVSGIGPDQWDLPGLGEWSVRDLVGHTSRALSTVDTYLAAPPAPVTLNDPRDYFAQMRGAGDPAAVAARGREAAAALGDDPAAAVAQLVGRVLRIVETSTDDALVATIFGGATLLTYLPTRTFELAVHTLDLVAAIGGQVPAGLAGPIEATLVLLASAIGAGPDGPVLLLAMTGRRPLPVGFSLV